MGSKESIHLIENTLNKNHRQQNLTFICLHQIHKFNIYVLHHLSKRYIHLLSKPIYIVSYIIALCYTQHTDFYKKTFKSTFNINRIFKYQWVMTIDKQPLCSKAWHFFLALFLSM